MNRHLKPSFAVLLGIWMVLLPATLPHALAGQRLHEEELEAEGLESILLKAGNGSARIVAGADDRIRIRVEVSPRQWTDEEPWRSIRDWFLSSSYDSIEKLLDAIRIDTSKRAGGELRIGLTPTGRTRKERVAEKWAITVPARMAAVLQMDYAEVEITGIEGGAGIRAGAGSVRIDVPRGNLRVALQVGDVDVKSGSGSIGDIDLRSTVGSTSLWMNGMRFEYPDPPGPGSEVSVSGRGKDTVHIAVELGDISVDIDGDRGRPGE